MNKKVVLNLSHDVSQFLSLISDSNSLMNQILSRHKEKLFSVKATPLTSRVLNHWIKEGLVDSSLEEGMYKFSLIDICYLEILVELRLYGFSIEKLRKVKESLYGEEMPYMDYAFARAASYKTDQTYLTVFTDGTANVMGTHDLLVNEKLNTHFTSYIKLNLNHIFGRQLKKKDSFVADRPFVTALSKEEKETIFNIRNAEDDLEEIKIKFKNGKIFELENIHLIDDEEDIKQIKKDNIPFGEVYFKYRNDKISYAKVVKKKRL
ncbi:hypothetical protein [Rickettsiales endosymbiont of Stachyamoeba lipophora]|uniref:hypothetical protein n=1 Tax=Rickettsiales endosymbiont of Stachyamoeba lipophora TaxID=2486578 RepID=UPI000F64C47A|nr:hypothetical protein [Rickettsiales endosymbiont of Stachyamoeba lipophora]